MLETKRTSRLTQTSLRLIHTDEQLPVAVAGHPPFLVQRCGLSLDLLRSGSHESGGQFFRKCCTRRKSRPRLRCCSRCVPLALCHSRHGFLL
jgi:hypothetical protein